jgi:hypothetical protein
MDFVLHEPWIAGSIQTTAQSEKDDEDECEYRKSDAVWTIELVVIPAIRTCSRNPNRIKGFINFKINYGY